MHIGKCAAMGTITGLGNSVKLSDVIFDRPDQTISLNITAETVNFNNLICPIWTILSTCLQKNVAHRGKQPLCN